jgi:hypothetical protein
MNASTLKLALPLAALLVAGACAMGPSERMAGTLLDPYCMLDGSALLVQYANSQGSFAGTRGRRENCAWHDAGQRIQTARSE